MSPSPPNTHTRAHTCTSSFPLPPLQTLESFAFLAVARLRARNGGALREKGGSIHCPGPAILACSQERRGCWPYGVGFPQESVVKQMPAFQKDLSLSPSCHCCLADGLTAPAGAQGICKAFGRKTCLLLLFQENNWFHSEVRFE